MPPIQSRQRAGGAAGIYLHVGLGIFPRCRVCWMAASGGADVSRQSGLAMSNQTLRAAAPKALHHHAGFLIRRIALAPLLQRIWELCDNVTVYDAAYLALAERLDGHW